MKFKTKQIKKAKLLTLACEKIENLLLNAPSPCNPLTEFAYSLFLANIPITCEQTMIGTLPTEYRRQSSEGYPTKVDCSVEEREIKNKKATETHESDRFRLSV